MIDDEDFLEEEQVDDGDVTLISEAAKTKLRRLLEARDRHDEAEAAAKRTGKELTEIELDVFEMFNDAGITGTIPVPLGPPYGTVKFRTRQTHFHKIADPDALQEYFENRSQIDEVSAPKFVAKRLNEIVRECVDNNINLPPGLSYSTRRGMTITRSKS